MDIYGNKLVNMIETKLLCISNLADMLTMVRGWILLILEVKGQGVCFLIKLGRHINHNKMMNPIDFEGQRSKVTMDMYGHKLVNMIETTPLCISSSNSAEMLSC